VKLPPVLPLYRYQNRWIDDPTDFKLAVKCARSGFSFATAAEAVLDCLRHPGTTWTCLSHGDRGSVEFLEEGVGRIIEAMAGTARIYKEAYADELGRTDLTQHRADFLNGSRIIALPSNPRTARGYPGNAILDEYAHHDNSYEIWAAIARQIALGHKLRVLSTPYGQQGMFYDLAKDLGLTDGVAPAPNPIRKGSWSGHWIDVNIATADGCRIDIPRLQELFKMSGESLQQEFYCAFLIGAEAWLSMELVAVAEDEAATLKPPWDLAKDHGFLALGVDFGRSGDRSCLWLDEYIGDVSWTRAVEWQFNMPFFHPSGKDQVHWLEPYVEMCDRAAMDSTGIGLGAFEYLSTRYPGKVMGVNFGGTVKRVEQGERASERGLASTVKIKTDMAVRVKSRFERRLNRIPRHLDIRNELLAIKREQTGTAITFDAPRIELDTPSGDRKKVFSHAEAFWAKAMADLAAAQPAASLSDGYITGRPRAAGFERQSARFEMNF
jgi:phage FluMu gp28-like protein